MGSSRLVQEAALLKRVRLHRRLSGWLFPHSDGRVFQSWKWCQWQLWILMYAWLYGLLLALYILFRDIANDTQHIHQWKWHPLSSASCTSLENWLSVQSLGSKSSVLENIRSAVRLWRKRKFVGDNGEVWICFKPPRYHQQALAIFITGRLVGAVIMVTSLLCWERNNSSM